jgi:acetate kinase
VLKIILKTTTIQIYNKRKACKKDSSSLKFYLLETSFKKKTCRKTKARFKSKSRNIKSQSESKTCRKEITIRDRDKYHGSYLQLEV